jgi:hypothetical protein
LQPFAKKTNKSAAAQFDNKDAILLWNDLDQDQ